MSHPPIGIDLGTTNSLVAVLEDGGPRVIASALGHAMMPSAVALDPSGLLLVGAPAAERAAHAPRDAVLRFKPDMGAGRTFPLRDVRYDATSLSAMVLRELRRTAEEALGQPIERVVVSVPAWFRDAQRRATLDAGRLAGLTIERLVNEPTAAALAYGLASPDREAKIVVLDLGGGTFDVSVLDLFDGVVEVLASVGDVHLGGEDFTDVVARELTRASVVVGMDPEAAATVRTRAELAKRRLSVEDRVEVPTDQGVVTLERSALERAWGPLTERMLRCVREALAQARLSAGEVDEVLLVGGATRMPLVQALARQVFRREPREGIDPDRVVALGAAVQAGLVQGARAVRELVATDVLTHSLGMAVTRFWDGQAYGDRFQAVLARGVTLPTSRTERFWTLRPDQTFIRVRLYEGEHREVTQNELLGELEVGDLPTSEDPDRRECIDVRFAHDLNGLLAVDVTVPATGARHQLLLHRGRQRLEGEAWEAAVAALERLRTPPRELLPNRYLLERAARLHVLLPASEAAGIDAALTSFEAALDIGDTGLIERRRAVLTGMVEALTERYHLGFLE